MGPRVCFPEVRISGYVTGACPTSGNVIRGRWHVTAVWVDCMKYFPCSLWVVSSLQMLPDTKVPHLTCTVLFPRTTAQWSTEHLPSTSCINQPAFPPARNTFCCMQQISHQIIKNKLLSSNGKFWQACPAAAPKRLQSPSTRTSFR